MVVDGDGERSGDVAAEVLGGHVRQRRIERQDVRAGMLAARGRADGDERQAPAPHARLDRLRNGRRPLDDDAVSVDRAHRVNHLRVAAPVAPAGAGNERLRRLHAVEHDRAAPDDPTAKPAV